MEDEGGGRELVDVDDPTDAHDDLLKPDCRLELDVLPEDPDTVAQPDFLGTTGAPSMSMSVLVLVEAPGSGCEVTTELGLAILMPCAAAILRNSFSSRLRSFSLRLSTSSLGLSRALACISLKRAL